jgi:hypothetical protein
MKVIQFPTFSLSAGRTRYPRTSVVMSAFIIIIVVVTMCVESDR